MDYIYPFVIDLSKNKPSIRSSKAAIKSTVLFVSKALGPLIYSDVELIQKYVTFGP
jgi:hypothetical protein